jgi:phage terminase large subunit-like protein
MTVPIYSTACPDWEDRIVNGESLIPFDPLFPDEASAALDIFKGLRIVDAPGRPTMGEACRPWVFDFVSTIFGSYDAESGRRLIRYFFLLIAKKNIKSTLAAGVMVTALIRNWRESGEFYILAPTKEVADNSYAPARDMVQADETLSSILKPSAGRVIEHRNTGAFLKVVAADSETVAGKKTIGLFVDELWLFGKRANAANIFREAMGGLASRPEGFVIDASTQGDGPPAGVFAQRLDKYRAIRDGKRIDQRSFGLLYEFPERMVKSGEYKDPKNFYIPNPNLNASVDEQYLLEQLGEAQQDGQSALIGFYAKHLNVQPGMALRADGWAGAVVWDRGIEVGLTLDEILRRSEVVTIGIDGGGLDDLLGVALIGREKGTKRWLGWAHALISDVGMERRKANIEDYNRFEQQGDLTKFEYVLPPITIELQKQLDGSYRDNGGEAPLAPVGTVAEVARDAGRQFIVDLVTRVQGLGLLAQVGVDAAGIGAIVDDLAGIGVTQDADTLDAVRQGVALMGAIKTIETKLAGYTFRHGNSEMLRWCVGNLRVIPTRTAMMVARDEAGFGKVDPLMALFNAAHLMSLNPEPEGSVYSKDRGLLIFDVA